MNIPTKQIITTIAILSMAITSFSGYYTSGLAYGQESNSHIPPIDDFPELPDFPDLPNPPSNPGCSPCPPGAYCAQIC